MGYIKYYKIVMSTFYFILFYFVGKKGVKDKSAGLQQQPSIEPVGAYSSEDFMPSHDDNEVDWPQSETGSTSGTSSMSMTVGGVFVGSMSSSFAGPPSQPLGVGGWGLDPGEKWRPILLPKKQETKIDIKPTAGRALPITAVAEPDESTDEVKIVKNELLRLVLKRLSPYFAIVNGNGDAKISSGEPPNILIDSERRAGNKEVTKVRGLQVFDFDVDTLAKDWQRRFACSASSSLVPGMVKEKEIVMQVQ